jgi:hypothetical protein
MVTRVLSSFDYSTSYEPQHGFCLLNLNLFG